MLCTEQPVVRSVHVVVLEGGRVWGGVVSLVAEISGRPALRRVVLTRVATVTGEAGLELGQGV